MKLSVQDAFKRISKKEIKKVEEKNYYLNAVVSILPPEKKIVTNFIFTYFNADKNEIIQILVDEKNVQIKPSAKATHPTTEKLDLNKLKVTHKKILKLALEIYKKHVQEPYSQIILALEKNEWKVSFITKALNVFIAHFDMQKGDVIKIHKESLLSTEVKGK